jgi:hypothetical protein
VCACLCLWHVLGRVPLLWCPYCGAPTVSLSVPHSEGGGVTQLTKACISAWIVAASAALHGAAHVTSPSPSAPIEYQ